MKLLCKNIRSGLDNKIYGELFLQMVEQVNVINLAEVEFV